MTLIKLCIGEKNYIVGVYRRKHEWSNTNWNGYLLRFISGGTVAATKKGTITKYSQTLTRLDTARVTLLEDIKKLNKPQCRYGSTLCKCPISSQTIKYRYKFKSNQFFFLLKILVCAPPRCVSSLESIAQV